MLKVGKLGLPPDADADALFAVAVASQTSAAVARAFRFLVLLPVTGASVPNDAAWTTVPVWCSARGAAPQCGGWIAGRRRLHAAVFCQPLPFVLESDNPLPGLGRFDVDGHSFDRVLEALNGGQGGALEVECIPLPVPIARASAS